MRPTNRPIAALLDERRDDTQHDWITPVLHRLLFQLQVQQLTDALHRYLVVVVRERRERVLEHVRCVCEIEQRQHAFVHALWVVDPARQHGVLHALHELRLDGRVDERVGGHVKEEEVLLLCCTHALLDQVLRESLAHVAQLVSQLQRVPSLTCAQTEIL